MPSNRRPPFKRPAHAGIASASSLSDREALVLEQQRQVAARLTATASQVQGTSKPTSSSSSSSTLFPPAAASATKRPTSSMAKQAALVQKQAQQEKLKQVLGTSSTTTTTRPVSSSTQKRPNLRNQANPPPPTTAAAALAAARTRAAVATAISNADSTTAAAAEPKRKTKTSQLAQLVMASMQTAEASPPLTTGSYGQVEPDDFWSHLRDWDFITQVAREQCPAKDQPEKQQHTIKPLPDTFVSHRHYIAAWAPLCLAEARAQLVSEATGGKKFKFAPVQVQTMKRDSGSAMDSLSVVIKPDFQGRGGEWQFMPHDLCVLIPADKKHDVERIFRKGDAENSYRNYGLVGHTEHSRKSLDGLVLKVSKRWWATIGTENMVLFQIGSNITALREFTALCRIESLPLRRYLLGQHLDDEKAKTEKYVSKNNSKHAMIHAMGGVDALGKGFTKYAHEKFNPSQLEAISAAAHEYGDGGFTLIKGPPGTGKTTTLVAVLNSLHIRQFNKYYEEVRKIAAMTTHSGNRKVALGIAVHGKPRLLVCAPSNAAVDNVILKIMEDGFKDGNGCRYNPSIIRVGVGQSAAVKDVALESEVDSILSENLDLARLETSIAAYKMELQRIQSDITRLRRRIHALSKASPWPLSKDWEIRIDENTFDQTGRVYFVNHKDKSTSFEVPPPPEPEEKQFEATAMPEYRSNMAKIVKLVESYNSITTKLERCTIIQGGVGGHHGGNSIQVRQQLETHILDSVHIVMTTLGTAGNRVLESAAKFEVVVVDEAAQSVEPATLSALQLGSRHCILVGDPQQLPATIFNVSGRNTKYDRSLFQRLEEGGHKVYMLNQQYRMHPAISHFPRKIFYDGNLLDGPNVLHPEYGNPLRRAILTKVHAFQPFTLLNLDSKEERGGTSLANSAEAHLAVHLYASLRDVTGGLSTKTRVAVITPYSQQANLLRQCFSDFLGPQYAKMVEVNTVDAFQGREANIVIFSCVRAAGSRGIGFLSDVRRMNVALTRAKFFLFVIARVESIVVNPYWEDLVDHARETNAVIRVHMTTSKQSHNLPPTFPNIVDLKAEEENHKPKQLDPRKRARSAAKTKNETTAHGELDSSDNKSSIPKDPRKRSREPEEIVEDCKPSADMVGARPIDPRKRG